MCGDCTSECVNSSGCECDYSVTVKIRRDRAGKIAAWKLSWSNFIYVMRGSGEIKYQLIANEKLDVTKLAVIHAVRILVSPATTTTHCVVRGHSATQAQHYQQSQHRYSSDECHYAPRTCTASFRADVPVLLVLNPQRGQTSTLFSTSCLSSKSEMSFATPTFLSGEQSSLDYVHFQTMRLRDGRIQCLLLLKCISGSQSDREC
jgi:hypothetical protein